MGSQRVRHDWATFTFTCISAGAELTSPAWLCFLPLTFFPCSRWAVCWWGSLLLSSPTFPQHCGPCSSESHLSSKVDPESQPPHVLPCWLSHRLNPSSASHRHGNPRQHVFIPGTSCLSTGMTGSSTVAGRKWDMSLTTTTGVRSTKTTSSPSWTCGPHWIRCRLYGTGWRWPGGAGLPKHRFVRDEKIETIFFFLRSTLNYFPQTELRSWCNRDSRGSSYLPCHLAKGTQHVLFWVPFVPCSWRHIILSWGPPWVSPLTAVLSVYLI